MLSHTTSRRPENTASLWNTAFIGLLVLARRPPFKDPREIWSFSAKASSWCHFHSCFWTSQNLEQTVRCSALARVCSLTICFTSSFHQFPLHMMLPITQSSYEKYVLSVFCLYLLLKIFSKKIVLQYVSNDKVKHNCNKAMNH